MDNDNPVEFNRNSGVPHLINQLEYTPDVVVLKNAEAIGLFKTLSSLMLKESEDERELRDECLRGYLSAYLASVIRLFEIRETKVKAVSVIDQFRDLVEAHYKKEHRVEFYANALGMTPKALSTLISRTLKKSARLIIQDRFLLEAKRYLAYSELTVAEVGFAVGFEDANYFSRFFKLHERVTPAQFREQAYSAEMTSRSSG